MNPYDKAHELARELTHCTEFLALQETRAAVEADAAAAGMLADYEAKQQAIYKLYQEGKVPAEEQVAATHALLDIMQQNSILSAYLVADSRMGRLINDIQKIIFSAVSPLES